MENILILYLIVFFIIVIIVLQYYNLYRSRSVLQDKDIDTPLAQGKHIIISKWRYYTYWRDLKTLNQKLQDQDIALYLRRHKIFRTLIILSLVLLTLYFYLVQV